MAELVDETEDEMNPRAFGGEVEAMSIGKKTRYLAEGQRTKELTLTSVLDIWRDEQILVSVRCQLPTAS